MFDDNKKIVKVLITIVVAYFLLSVVSVFFMVVMYLIFSNL